MVKDCNLLPIKDSELQNPTHDHTIQVINGQRRDSDWNWEIGFQWRRQDGEANRELV
jgi:glucose-6-phosphate dehydrogenase assembly protein OpcA